MAFQKGAVTAMVSYRAHTCMHAHVFIATATAAFAAGHQRVGKYLLILDSPAPPYMTQACALLLTSRSTQLCGLAASMGPMPRQRSAARHAVSGSSSTVSTALQLAAAARHRAEAGGCRASATLQQQEDGNAQHREVGHGSQVPSTARASTTASAAKPN